MSSPLSDNAPAAKPSLWSRLEDWALLTPVLVVVWMLVAARLEGGDLRLRQAHFRDFYFWNGLGLASLAWGLGAATRWVRGTGLFSWPVRQGWMMLAAVALTVLAARQMSWQIVLALAPLISLGAFYLGQEQMSRQERGAVSLTVMVGAFFGAIFWMGLRNGGLNPASTVARGWLAMGCFVSAWLAIRSPQMVRPQLQLPQAVVGAYLFAAATAVPTGAWGGEMVEVLQRDATLLTAMTMGLTLWMRRYSELEDSPERLLLARLIPLSLCAELGALCVLWSHAREQERAFWIVLGAVVISLLTLFAVQGKLPATTRRVWLWATWVWPIVWACI